MGATLPFLALIFVGVELFGPSAWSATLTSYGCDRVDEVFEYL
jgi:hypothetical protein